MFSVSIRNRIRSAALTGLVASAGCIVAVAPTADATPTLPDLSRNPVIKYRKGAKARGAQVGGDRNKLAQGAPTPAGQPATTSGGVDIPQETPQLRGMGADTPQERQQLEQLADEAIKSEGTVFVGPDKVLVKKPVLTALITLNQDLPSPYSLEALDSRPIDLPGVLTAARAENLEIKISAEDVQSAKWLKVGAVGGFLPTFTNDYQMQAITGHYVSAGGLTLPIKNLYLTSNNSVTQYLYKGGSILHTYLQTKHNYRATKWNLNRTMADILSDAATAYHELVLADVVLQIRVKAVQVAQGLVILNKDLFQDGVNTKLDVLQAEYELSRNRQDLIAQQIQRREAAVKLATILNINPNADLVITDRLVAKSRLVEGTAKITDLVSVAIDNRPELKRYEELRLAAKEQVKIARAALLPSVSTTGSIIGTSARVFDRSSSSNNGGSTSLTTGGAGVGGISDGASLPLTGGTSGQRHWAAKSLFLIGLDANWTIGGASVTEIGQINSAKAQARKLQLEFNRELTFVYKDVHDQFLASLSADNMIRETSDAVTYAEEQLRVAQVRFTEGVGTYIDVITAQRNYTAALVSKAQALIDFNIAQTKLVRAVGRVSVDTLANADSVRVK